MAAPPSIPTVDGYGGTSGPGPSHPGGLASPGGILSMMPGGLPPMSLSGGDAGPAYSDADGFGSPFEGWAGNMPFGQTGAFAVGRGATASQSTAPDMGGGGSGGAGLTFMQWMILAGVALGGVALIQYMGGKR